VDLEPYLRRIEYDGPRTPSAAVLRGLHRQHLFTVPFENLDIPLKTPIRLERQLIYEKIVVRRRGGFCYELNGLFYELLTGLGFKVVMLSARVRRENGGFGPEFDHMLLKVELEEPWLVDVGFGDSFVNPVLFRSGSGDEINGHRYLVATADDEWELLRQDGQGQVALYRFRDVPRQLSDYEEMCLFHQTAPESHFTKSWICSKATPEGRITLANMRLIITRDGLREENVLTQAEVRRCLRDQLGIQLPASVDLSALSTG